MRRDKLNEELKVSDVKEIVDKKLDKLLRERDFEKRVNEISTKILERFISDLFTKKSLWLSVLKK